MLLTSAAACLQEAASLRIALAAAQQKEEDLQSQLGRLREDLARAGAECEALRLR